LKLLGIDPGLSICGYGILEVSNSLLICEDFGNIRTQNSLTMAEKLDKIYQKISNIIQIHKPRYCAIEDIFYHTNIKTAIVMGHARGVIMLAAQQANVEIFEYSPREVKMSITGSGASSKHQIQAMVKQILNLKVAPPSLDSSDALAVAICHYHRLRFHKLISV